mmetsp:Transcript_30628/g.72891  ORF Transcript_30628/g.72891 Transcript_30628/m.72891 type:complete len:229 (+) Transcript_30628:1569-2255(+)
MLDVPVGDAEGDDGDEEPRGDSADDDERRGKADGADEEGADALPELHVHGLHVLGEAVDQPARRLGVVEGHRQRQHGVEEHAVHLAGGRDRALHHGDDTDEGCEQGAQAESEEDADVAHVVRCRSPGVPKGILGPNIEPPVLDLLQAALRSGREDQQHRQDEEGPPRGDVGQVQAELHPPLGAPLGEDERPGTAEAPALLHAHADAAVLLQICGGWELLRGLPVRFRV